MSLHRGLQIDQHHDAEFCGDPGKSNEANRCCDRLIVTQEVKQPEAAREGKRQSSHNQHRFIDAAEDQIEQQENDAERGRNDNLQTLIGPSEIFKLSRVRKAYACRQIDTVGHGGLQVAHY